MDINYMKTIRLKDTAPTKRAPKQKTEPQGLLPLRLRQGGIPPPAGYHGGIRCGTQPFHLGVGRWFSLMVSLGTSYNQLSDHM